MTGFAERPAGVLFDQAVELARDTFDPDAFEERQPRIFTHLENARMGQVAVCGFPELTARFVADWEPFVRRIHAIDRVVAPPALRVVA